MNKQYQDIIHLPHKQSSTRPHMPIADRAAQFAPFSALAGHDSVLRETARRTEEEMELSEEMEERLNRKLQILAENMRMEPVAAVTYFTPDEKKEGGYYKTKTGALKKLDPIRKILVFQDGTLVSIESIREIACTLFDE